MERHHLMTKNTGGHVKVKFDEEGNLESVTPRRGHSGSQRPARKPDKRNPYQPKRHRCRECGELRVDDERVHVGMKCALCAYSGVEDYDANEES